MSSLARKAYRLFSTSSSRELTRRQREKCRGVIIHISICVLAIMSCVSLVAAQSCGGYFANGLTDEDAAPYQTGLDCQGLSPQTVTETFSGVVLSGGRVSWWGSWAYGTMTNTDSLSTCPNPPIQIQFPQAMLQVRITVGSWIAQDVTLTTNLGDTQTVSFGTYGFRSAEFFGGGITTVSITSSGRGFYLGNQDYIPDCSPDRPVVNAGVASCKSHVGGPINVTNGDMYLEQTDYDLPSVGPGINVTRTYNSISPSVGIFGKGWSSTYDERIKINSSTSVSWFRGDGQASTFTSSSSSGPFHPVQQDFHGVLTQNSDYSFTVSFTNGSIHQFDSSGKLLSQTDRNGNQTSLAYDNNGKLLSITDPFGRVLTVTTNSNGQVVSIGDSLGTIASYSYGASSQLLSVTYADSSVFTFTYDGSLRLTTVKDALQNVVEAHTYDAQGRALTSEKQGGVDRYTLSYVSSTETDVTDGLGRVTKFTFDKTHGRNLVTRTEGLCSCGGSQVQTWTYDSQLNTASKTDALGHATSYAYNSNANPLTLTDATGSVAFTYNGYGEVLTRTDQMNNVTTNAYDSQGNLLTSTDPLNNATTFTYNSHGQMLTATDALGRVTSFTYDSLGNLTRRTDANSIITFFFYDARRRLTKVSDGLSRSTLFGYDAFGRINKVTHPDLSFVSVTYDLAGRRTVVTDERGNPTNYGYDGDYRLTSVTDALSHASSYGYDSMSNLTSVTDALSQTTNYDYDSFNRLVKITYPPATTGATRLFETIAYDGDSNVTSRTDTANRTTSYSYDNVNRLTSTTDAANETTSFVYDALSRATSLTDAVNQQYQFGYDALGRQTAITRGALSMSYVYDAVGNRTQRTDYNGAITNYGYDSLNRLTTITYPTRTVTYDYDPLNNLTRAQNENGTIYIGYDNRYRVNSLFDPFFYGISYNYDAVGNRTKLKVNGATYATYTYDAVNRLTSLTDNANLSFTYNYDAANRLVNRTAPNGITTNFTYDGMNRLLSLMHNLGGTTVSGNAYTYDDANRMSGWTTINSQRVYTYDLIDRLATVTNFESPSENYAYDHVGNRTASHLAGTYGYQPFNRLLNTDNTTYSYDNNGNLVSKTDASGTTSYSFNEENQLGHVTLPNGLTVDYTYDALGRRIQRTTGAGANERYVYDGADGLIDLKSDWSVANTYLNDLGIDNHLRQTSANSAFYFLTDHLGSTSALSDPAGGVIAQMTYDSFGNSAGTNLTRYGYTGRERDSDTALLYYRARFYDPQVGRFVSEDPIGFHGGINQFAYVGNHPQSAVDPSGEYEIDVHYYLTYFLALKTGCFKDWVANDIANEDQLTDDNSDTMPGAGTTDQQRMQNRIYHALSTGAAEGVGSSLLWRGAMNETSGHRWIGRYLHYLQDTYSHAGYTSDIWGHSPPNLPFGSGVYGDHDVDKTATDPEKAMRMAGGTWNGLVQYAKAIGCNCNPRWDNAWWKQISDFINVDTAYPRSSTIDAFIQSVDNPGLGDPAALTRKRRTLGLTDRYSGEW